MVTRKWKQKKKTKFSFVVVCCEELRISSYITKVAWLFLKVYNFITDIPRSRERIPWCESLTSSRAFGAYLNFLLLTSIRNKFCASSFLPRFPHVLSFSNITFILSIPFLGCSGKNASVYEARSCTRKWSWFPIAVKNCTTLHWY